VRSSTSSSDGRAWLASWGLALLLTLACIIAWETFWRARGFSPSVTDDAALWVAARREVRSDDPAQIVLVGSSRTQVDIEARAFTRATGWRKPVQLAVTRGPTVPVLANLADESEFEGIVIAEVNPVIFFASLRVLDEVIDRHLERLRSLTPANILELRLGAFIQQRLAFRLPALSPPKLKSAIEQGRWPRPSHYTIGLDRYRSMDFERLPRIAALNRQTAAARARSKLRFFGPKELANRLSTVATLVETIESRGGDVIFLRLPTNGHIRRNEREVVPRKHYWNIFAAQSNALTIHFEDHPELASFRAPDGEHLDHRDAIAFSEQLGKVILSERAKRLRE
jgi:hypothetical protein